MSKIGLVLEGGGMRGAYTAGCLSWLIDNNVEFDYSVGISSGAMHLASFWLKNAKFLEDISVKTIASKEVIGIRSLLHEGTYVGSKTMTKLLQKMRYNTALIKEKNLPMEFGIYDLEQGKTVFFNAQDLDDDLIMLGAACTLPIAGRIVDYRGMRLLDGGITKMVPIERALEQGCDKTLVIVTKPAGYVRKPGGFFMNTLMKLCYPKYKQMCYDYSVRHLNYNQQMEMVYELEKENKAILMRPSKTIAVARFSGDPENLKVLYDLGYQDMENRREQILEFVNKEN